MTYPKNHKILFVLLIVVFSYIFLLGIFKISDHDVWTHLAMGRYIVTEKAIPDTVRFTYTSFGLPDINHEWLFQAILYWIYNITGVSGMIIFKASVITITFFLLYKAAKIRGGGIFVTAVILVLTARAARFRFFERPEIFLYLFTAASLFLLYLYKFRSKNYLFLLPLLQLLWANIHISSILGVALPATIAFGEGLKSATKKYTRWNSGDVMNTKKLAFLFATAFLNLLSLFVNPFSISGLTEANVGLIRGIVSTSILKENIDELQRAALMHFTGIGIDYLFEFGILTVLGLASFVLLRKRLDITDLLIFIPFTLAGFYAIRFVGLASIIIAPIISSNLSRWITSLKLRDNHSKFSIPFSISFILLILGSFFFEVLPDTKVLFGIGVKERIFPVKAVEFIRESRISGNMFNSIGYGGYLNWKLYPERKVFIDGRIPGGENFYKLYLDVHKSEELWEKVTKEYNISYVLLENSRKERINHLFNNPDWALVFWDDTSLIFVRKTQENGPIISKNEYHLAFPNLFDFSYLGHFLENTQLYYQVHSELKHCIDSSPFTQEAHLALAYIYDARGELLPALKNVEEAININPNQAMAYSALGLASFKLGRYENAEKAALKASRLDPWDPTSKWILATLYDMRGDVKKAIKGWKIFLKVYGNHDGIRSLAEERIRILENKD